MKKNKAFTLFELLAAIIILGIVVSMSIVIYMRQIDITKNNINKIEEKNIINSVSAYYIEFKNNPNYKKEIIYNKNGQTTLYSCVTLKSLIEGGYLDEINSKNVNENTIIKISTINGVTNYEILTNDDDDICTYYKLNKKFENISTVTDVIDDNKNFISFGSEIHSINKNEDIYALNLDLKLEFSDFDDFFDKFPIYVLIVSDKSGSMADDYKGENKMKFSRARTAAINLSEKVVNINNNSYIGLIQFGTNINYVNFQRTPLVEKNFILGGNTNIIAGLDKAIEMMQEAPSTAIKYVLFLSDGYPSIVSEGKWYNSTAAPVYNTTGEYWASYLPYSYQYYKTCHGEVKDNSNCSSKLYEYRDTLSRINGSLVIVSYEMSSVEVYKKVASLDYTGYICPNAITYNGEKHCYYEAAANTIDTLFDNISNSILSLVNNISTGKIRGNFTEAIKVYDTETNEEIKNIEINVDFDRGAYINTNNFKYAFQINDIGIECEKNICEGEDFNFSLFDGNGLILDLYDVEGNFLQSLNLGSPKLKITATKDSYLN